MAEEHNKTKVQIIADHLDFFVRNRSGCAFAAYAARDALKYEWCHVTLGLEDVGLLNEIIAESVASAEVSTLSVIFPEVRTFDDLFELLPRLIGEQITLHEVRPSGDNACIRLRSRVGAEQSYVSGFGPFDLMPVTRQTPHTSIVMRVGPRPNYDWYLKEPDEGLVHVADMDMKGLDDKALERMWKNSFFRTAGLLGKSPDEESAAKTTFVIPLADAHRIFPESG